MDGGIDIGVWDIAADTVVETFQLKHFLGRLAGTHEGSSGSKSPIHSTELGRTTDRRSGCWLRREVDGSSSPLVVWDHADGAVAGLVIKAG
ncbi:hypothetical protein QP157_21375 [Sphingomonas sp. LR61]|uniref:hypothetical protein n=1 Tax=Sphingomonas sp. LR61 TaxID=3050234 RepID=UPI002FE0F78B